MQDHAPTSRRVRLGTLAACAFAGSFAATLVVDLAQPHGASATETEASPYANLAIFARALSHVETSHVEPPDQDALIYGAIRGMIETLDPHSSFLDPDEIRLGHDAPRFQAHPLGFHGEPALRLLVGRDPHVADHLPPSRHRPRPLLATHDRTLAR